MERAIGVLREPEFQGKFGPTAVSVLRRPFSTYVNDGVRQRVRLRLALALGPTHPACADALSEYEPYPMWTRPILEFRAACYAAQHNPRFELAERDLNEFRELEPRSFDDLLPDIDARPGPD